MLEYHSTRSLGPAPEPLPSEIAMYLCLKPIVVEFESDPMSVQCFDLRIVARAKWVVSKFEGRFKRWMQDNAPDVDMIQRLIVASAG